MSNNPDAPLVETVSKRSPFGALVSRTLPKYTGSYPVGICDIELPVPTQTIGIFKHRKLSDTPAGLVMDTVLFSVFYPAEDVTSKDHMVWFPK